MSDAENKVTDAQIAAAENVAAAEVANAEAAASIANAVVAEKTTETAQAVVATAEVAAAQAHQAAATVTAQAAEEINKNKGELEWLRSNQESMANSQQSLATELGETRKTLNTMAGNMTALMEGLQSLTRKPSEANPAQEQVINPRQVNSPSAPADDRQDSAPNKPQKKKRDWI